MKSRRLLMLSLTIAFLQFSVTACNTIAGAGKDIEAAGDAIENEAKKHKTY